MKLQMVDLKSQYQNIKIEIDEAIQEVIDNTTFIKGPAVAQFNIQLAQFLNVHSVVSCANGTDALQIAMMALDLKPGDEVIVPSFTYVATAEVIGLLGLTPVLIDVDPDTFNITAELFEKAITPKTKLVVPVHLFGQAADMEGIMKLARQHNIFVIEDTAQALGADYTFSDGSIQKLGTIGDIGCTSFFPSKNLGCFGDGGATYTNNPELATQLQMIANHGQPKQYTHDVIGVNSRLDTIQAAVLNVKIKYLDQYNLSRQKAANYYDTHFGKNVNLQIPHRNSQSNHVFHQYTLKVLNGKRDELKAHLQNAGIPSMIYYPKPLHHQKAYENLGRKIGDLTISETLCSEVLSLPMHTEMNDEQLAYIVKHVNDFFENYG